jgi:hypothetical protein
VFKGDRSIIQVEKDVNSCMFFGLSVLVSVTKHVNIPFLLVSFSSSVEFSSCSFS